LSESKKGGLSEFLGVVKRRKPDVQ